MIEPTERQMELIEKIEDALDVDFSQWCEENGRSESKGAAMAFIDEYIEDYRREFGF